MWYNYGMLVKSVRCKLRTNDDTASALADTMKRFNAACNDLSEQAWNTQTFRAFDLHRIAYHGIRERHGLPAQLTVRAISKVTDSYKTDRSAMHSFGPRSAVVYDARCFKMHGISSASLTTTKGRFRFSLAQGGKQREQLAAGMTGEADLLYIDGVYYLSIAVKFPDVAPSDTSGGVLGVDLGIVEIATDSTGQSFSGEAVKAMRRRVRQHRRKLQAARSRSGYKRLQKVRHRQSRYVADVNHCISKAIVIKAQSQSKAIAMESLTGIRERSHGFGKEMRWLMGNWSFADLGQKVAYKAAFVGVPVIYRDPRNSSRTCSVCGHCDKANRKSQSLFLCLKCGFRENADFNAARNLESGGYLSTALVVPPVMGEGQTPLLAAG